MAEYTVTLEKLVKDFSLKPIYLPKPVNEILIRSADVNRPGLQLAGFTQVFDETRIQVLGKSEMVYMQNFTEEEAARRYEDLFALHPPAVIVCRYLDLPDVMISTARQYGIPLLATMENTSAFMASLISYLNVEMASRITRHGVMVEVYGEGILITGDSGVGKSEAAIELIKRGHRLVADDAVELRKVSSRTLVGSSPNNIRHFMELRGIGVINARRLFGMGAIKPTEKVELIVNLEAWDDDKVYDRLGTEDQYSEILGIRIPTVTIPVKPGRNLAVIIEVAAMNMRQKKYGYNAANELLQQLGMEEGGNDQYDF
jgi:HPr kinase/phosphorylase